MGRRAGRGRHPRRLGRRRGEDRTAGRGSCPHVPAHARRRPADEPAVRARQPLEAQRGARPRHRGGARTRARARRPRRRVPHEHPRVGARPPRPRRRCAAGAQRAARVRDHHRLRARRPRRRPPRLRHRRVLGPLGPRGGAHAARRAAAVPAGRHGRSQRGDDGGGDDQRGTVRPRAHRAGPARVHLAAPPGRLHDRLRRQHRPDVGAIGARGRARIDGQPGDQQLHRGRRPALLDRGARG